MLGRIVALAPDLLIESRIAGAARRIDTDLESINDGLALKDALSKPTDVLIVDLSVAGIDLDAIVAEASDQNVPIVAFGPHVDTELLKTAKDAGIHSIYPRNAFLKNLHKILAKHIPAA